VNCTGWTDSTFTVPCPGEAGWEIRARDPDGRWLRWFGVCQDHALDFIAVMGGPANTYGYWGQARTLDGTQDMTVHVTDDDGLTEGFIERIEHARRHGQDS